MINFMDLNHLRCFYEVAKAGSFTHAAASLHTSQSALSKAVGLLESREGVILFERSKKGVKLTAIGQEIFDQCQLIFNGVQEIRDRVQGATVKCEGYLRFGVSDHLARYLLIEELCGFHKIYPKVIPSLFIGGPTEISNQIMKNDLEFGLFFTRINTPGLEYKRLGLSELVLVTSANTDGKIEMHQIQEYGIVGSISREYQKHPSSKIFDLTKTQPKINIETNSQDLQKQICLSGVGCALLARFMVAEELRNKQLHEIKLSKRIYTNLFLAKRKKHVFTRPAQRFIEEIVLKLPKII